MENMDNELDLVTFEDDDGNEMTMEVVDYLFYEGKEYALLTEYDENAPEDDGEPKDAHIMEVRPVEGDDEMEEFVAIEEALAEKLIDIFQSGGLDEDEEYEIGEAPEEE